MFCWVHQIILLSLQWAAVPGIQNCPLSPSCRMMLASSSSLLSFLPCQADVHYNEILKEKKKKQGVGIIKAEECSVTA